MQKRTLYQAIKDVPPFTKDGKIKTGFIDLDSVLKIDPGDLVVIAGKTSEGKTSLGIQTLYNNARQGKAVGMISLEMVAGGVRKRMEGSFGSLPDNFFIADPSALCVSDFRKICSALKREQGVDLVLLDYLQLMREKQDYTTRHLEISHIIRSLKEIAKQLDIGVFVISQLSRQVDYRGDLPSLGDLKESGDIEYAADVVVLIHSPQESEAKLIVNTKVIIVAKNRWGPKGKVTMYWDGPKTIFRGKP